MYLNLGKPFRNLNLGVHYSQLTMKVKENMDMDTIDKHSKTEEYAKHMGACFFIKYFIFKFLPCLCCRKYPEKKEQKVQGQKKKKEISAEIFFVPHVTL